MILTVALRLIARIAWLIIASVAVIALIAAASAASSIPPALIAFGTRLAFARIVLRLGRFRWLAAEEILQPAKETARGSRCRFGGATGSHVARLR